MGPLVVSNDIGKVLKLGAKVWTHCQFRSMFLSCIVCRIACWI